MRMLCYSCVLGGGLSTPDDGGFRLQSTLRTSARVTHHAPLVQRHVWNLGLVDSLETPTSAFTRRRVAVHDFGRAPLHTLPTMARYSRAACDELMKNVSMSVQVIQASSSQIIFWKRHATEIVQSWDEEFRAADMEKRLILIYLANDIVQTSKLQGRHFVESFHPILLEAFKHMVKHSDSKGQGKLKKLVAVWRDRKIWGNRLQARYDDLVRGIAGDEDAGPAAPPDAGKPSAANPYAALHAKQHEIVKLSQKAQGLMMSADAARKALSQASERVRTHVTLAP